MISFETTSFQDLIFKLCIVSGIIDERKRDNDDEDDDGADCDRNRSVRSSAVQDSDSD